MEQVEELRSLRDAILAEVGKVIVGQSEAVEAMLVAMLAQGTCSSRACRARPRR
ncbi:MAG: hypothetical protein M5U28_56835 [Sandaracinaceae bacterium]|nr:hypothetical protein [Sandaracinaceae bacterium]